MAHCAKGERANAEKHCAQADEAVGRQKKPTDELKRLRDEAKALLFPG